MSDCEKPHNEEFHLAHEKLDTARSEGATSSEVFASPKSPKCPQKREGKIPVRPRFKSANKPKVVTPISSSIPLLVKGSPSTTKGWEKKKPHSIIPPFRDSHRHTLEIQYVNKNKRYLQLRSEIIERQRPLADIYKSLLQIKKKLGEQGRTVKVEEVRFVSFEELNKKPPSSGGGEAKSLEMVNNMKNSIEDIPRTLIDICKNLLGRRATIVGLLEGVARAEVDVEEVSAKIESLKIEGIQLEQSLDLVLQEHEGKIAEIIANWQSVLNDKHTYKTDSRIQELESRLMDEERFRNDSAQLIQELQHKMDEKRASHDKTVTDLHSHIQNLNDQIKKLEHDLDFEKRTAGDFKSRNNTNATSLKQMKSKVAELEGEKIEAQNTSSDLQKKLKLLQDQMKIKETQWQNEKNELNRNLKHQENLLQKITAEKSSFETRLTEVGLENNETSTQQKKTMDELQETVRKQQLDLDESNKLKREALDKLQVCEEYIQRMQSGFKQDIFKVSSNISCTNVPSQMAQEADKYMEGVAKDLLISQLQDQIQSLEKTILKVEEEKPKPPPSFQCIEIENNRVLIENYQRLIERSEEKLKLKAAEVARLQDQINQLHLRYGMLEDENERCNPNEIHRELEEGRRRLSIVTKTCMDTTSMIGNLKAEIVEYEVKIGELEKSLNYRDNIIHVVKNARNDLLKEKDSLTKYAKEMRTALAEIHHKYSKQEEALCIQERQLYERKTKMLNMEEQIKDLESTIDRHNHQRQKLHDVILGLESQLAEKREIENSVKDSNKTLKCYTSFVTQRFDTSRSLITHSLRTIDLIKNKLDELSTVDSINRGGFLNKNNTIEEHQSLNEIVEIANQRYEFLKGQADESYDDLTGLVKFAVRGRK